MSRITIEERVHSDHRTFPLPRERNNRNYYVTIPWGLSSSLEELLLPLLFEPLMLLDIFINRRLRNFYTFMRSRVFSNPLPQRQISHLTALRSIERKSESKSKPRSFTNLLEMKN